jgi:hypothetical protein
LKNAANYRSVLYRFFEKLDAKLYAVNAAVAKALLGGCSIY